MPKPVYIICSGSGSEDKTTGLISLFQVIEKLRFSSVVPLDLSIVSPLMEMRVTAIWMRCPEDEGQEFEFETRVLLPPEDTIIKLGEQGKFSFAQHHHRLVAIMRGFPPFRGSGIMRFQSRLRRAGTEEWLFLQEYPVIVEQEIAAVAPTVNPASAN